MADSSSFAFGQLDLLGEQFATSAQAILSRARASAAAIRHPGLAAPLVSLLRHEEVKQAYRDYQLFSSFVPDDLRRFELADGFSLIGEDPPVHTRIRSSIAKVFSAHAIAELEASVRENCEKLFDRVVGAGEFDAVEDLAAKLTVGVIAKLVGVPESDYALVRDWTVRQSAINGTSIFFREVDPRWDECEAITQAANDEMQVYFEARVDERLASPRSDILTRLIQSGIGRQEAISFAKLLVMAGNETTTNLINNSIRLLIDHPEQQSLLRESPELAGPAVEEVLRFSGPIRYSVRTTTRNAEIGGMAINEGDGVVLWVASANRDERRYLDPDRFDILRGPTGLLGFGHGLHACVGSPLARLEARVFMETLLTRTRCLERTRQEMPPVPSPIFEGVAQQYVSFEAA
jgi:cytochrome P450